jgi:hypothetical protein
MRFLGQQHPDARVNEKGRAPKEDLMTTRNASLAVLLLSAVWAAPAAADMPKGAIGASHDTYTDDIARGMHAQRVKNRENGLVAPVTGSQYRGMLVPTVGDRRAALPSDSSTYWLQQAAQVHNTIVALNNGREPALAQLEGSPVTDSHGSHLGKIIRVDESARLAEVYMKDVGKSVAMPVDLLTPKGGFVQAMTVSKADALAMARTQHQTAFASLY